MSSSVDVSGFSHLSILDLIARLEIIKVLNCLRGGKSPTKQKLLVPLKMRQCLLGFLGEVGIQRTRSIWKCKQSQSFCFLNFYSSVITKELHGDTKVCKPTPPEATQASDFFLPGI